MSLSLEQTFGVINSQVEYINIGTGGYYSSSSTSSTSSTLLKMAICDICYCSITTPCHIYVRGECQREFCFRCIKGRFLIHSTCREELSIALREKVGEWNEHEMATPTLQDRQTSPNRDDCPSTPREEGHRGYPLQTKGGRGKLETAQSSLGGDLQPCQTKGLQHGVSGEISFVISIKFSW